MHYKVVLVNRETSEEKVIMITSYVDEAADKAWEWNVNHFGYELMQDVCSYCDFEKGNRFGDVLDKVKWFADFYGISDDTEKEREMQKMENKKNDTVNITIYADSTGLYTKRECDINNLVDFDVPTEIVREYFYSRLKDYYPDKTFEEWLREVSTADDYEADDYEHGFIELAKKRGYQFNRSDNKVLEDILAMEINDKINERTDISYEGYISSNLMESIEIARQNGSMYDLDNMVHLKEILGFSVSYGFYHFVEEKLTDGYSMELDDNDKQKLLKWLYEYAIN